jgi:hypothetical protein
MIPESARRLPQRPEKAVLPQDSLQMGESGRKRCRDHCRCSALYGSVRVPGARASP